VRDALLLAIALMSLWLTPTSAHAGNEFRWGPIREVAQLFLAIFVTIVPVIAILRAGEAGTFAPIIHIVAPDGIANSAAFFWLTGALSAFLDSAPAYLVFFNLAGAD